METDERTLIERTADEVQAQGTAIAARRGMQVVTMVVTDEGAFQMRSTASLNVNVLIGLFARAMVLVTVGFKDALPPGKVVRDDPPETPRLPEEPATPEVTASVPDEERREESS